MPDRSRPDLLVAFGAAVRRLRRDRGWSQEEFADRVGVHRTYMGSVERGERNLSLLNIGRIADALHMTLSALMAEVERDGGEAAASGPLWQAPTEDLVDELAGLGERRPTGAIV